MPEIAYEFVTRVPDDALVELYKAGRWWREDPAWRASLQDMVRGSFCFLVARDGTGKIVGMGRVLSDGVSDAYIQDVVVLETHRGRGIGGGMIRRLTDRCVEARIGWIGLVAEPGTQAFYERLGFRVLPGHLAMLHGKPV